MTLQIGGPPPGSTTQVESGTNGPAFADQYLGGHGAYGEQPAAAQMEPPSTAGGMNPIQQYVFSRLAPHFEANGVTR